MTERRRRATISVAWCAASLALVLVVVAVQGSATTTDPWYSVPRLVAGVGAIAAVTALAGAGSLSVRRLPRGLLWGAPALVVAALALAASLSSAGAPSGPVAANGPGTVAVFTLSMVSVGVFEEGTFRGLLLDRLDGTTGGPVAAAAVSSVVFGLAHGVNAWRLGVPATVVQVAYAALIGLFFAAVRLRSGSLLAVIALHAVLDWCFYLVSDAYAHPMATPASPIRQAVVPLVLALLLALWGCWLLRRRTKVEAA